MKKLFRKFSLFCNAFLIMNLLFLGKESYLYATKDKNYFILSGIILISISIGIGLVGLIYIFRKSNSTHYNCTVIKKQNKTDSYYFGYFSLFVLLFMSFDLSDVLNLITFIVLMLILSIVYCRNSMFYINPTILLLGKRIFALTINKNDHFEDVLVIANFDIKMNEQYAFFSSNYEFTTCKKL